jgi:5-methyltetrahydrofolate--homocysteine methyltransferase
MKENLELMARRGLTIPAICGGAALNRSFVENDLADAYTTGEVYYAPDAFAGLRLMEELCGHVKTRTLTGPGRKRARRRKAEEPTREVDLYAWAKSDVEPAERIPAPPFLGTRVLGPEALPLPEIFAYLNKRALFRGQWQYRRGRRTEAEYRRFLADEVEPKFRLWCQRVIERRWLEPRLVYGYFHANGDGNDLIVWREDGAEWLRIRFPRQPDLRRLCLADYFRPVESGEKDVVAFQVVTVGAVATQVCEELFAQNRYDDYLHFHGLAVETAEALAEYWHKKVRQELGIAGQDARSVEGLLSQGYQGSRYSFGYPACPRLEDQVHVFSLLEPARIGLSLSSEFQIIPEQSTSAMVVHHPAAKYFNIG